MIQHIKRAGWLPVSLAVLCVMLLSQCQPQKQPPQTRETVLQSDSGLASYYARFFEGKKTASGKIFDNDEAVAAHPGYPLGTRVRVTNLDNSKTVELLIIDRGPTTENQEEGVIIDISRAAAKKIGMLQEGRIPAKVEVLQWGNDSTSSDN